MSESMRLARDLSNSELIAMAKKFYHPESPGYQIAERLLSLMCTACGQDNGWCRPDCPVYQMNRNTMSAPANDY